MPRITKKVIDNREGEKLFKILEYQQKQLLSQHEKIDKWFRFYLLIIGAPFPILVGLLQAGVLASKNGKYDNFIMLIAFSLFWIGFFFFIMSIYQRKNMINIYFRKMAPLEKKLYEKPPLNDKNDLKKIEEAFKNMNPNPHGAEFWVRMVYMFINSLWGAVFIFSVSKSSSQICNYVITVIVFLFVFFIQLHINFCKLSKDECKEFW